jgi:hypothetical protein
MMTVQALCFIVLTLHTGDPLSIPAQDVREITTSHVLFAGGTTVIKTREDRQYFVKDGVLEVARKVAKCTVEPI